MKKQQEKKQQEKKQQEKKQQEKKQQEKKQQEKKQQEKKQLELSRQHELKQDLKGQEGILGQWHSVLLKAMDLIYPRRCPVCDDAVKPFGKLICDDCRSKVRLIAEPYCMKCGKQLSESVSFCPDCQKKRHYYDRGVALFEYKSMSASLYHYKYSGRREYADYYGTVMAEHFKDLVLSWNADALVPVPIHQKRMQKRGYNQAALLADVLSKHWKLPVVNKLAVRCRNTVPQKELGHGARQNNLKKAFKICGNDVELNTIVIIDDIYTTGSTIDSLAYEFRRAGVKKVYFLALTIGKGI